MKIALPYPYSGLALYQIVNLQEEVTRCRGTHVSLSHKNVELVLMSSIYIYSCLVVAVYERRFILDLIAREPGEELLQTRKLAHRFAILVCNSRLRARHFGEGLDLALIEAMVAPVVTETHRFKIDRVEFRQCLEGRVPATTRVSAGNHKHGYLG